MPTAEPLIEQHRSLVKAALALDNDPPAIDRSRSMVAVIIVVAAAAGLVVGSAIAPRSTAAETQRSAQRVTWVERWVPKKHEPAHPASRGPKPKPPPTKRKARDSKPDPRAHRPTPAPKAPPTKRKARNSKPDPRAHQPTPAPKAPTRRPRKHKRSVPPQETAECAKRRAAWLFVRGLRHSGPRKGDSTSL